MSVFGENFKAPMSFGPKGNVVVGGLFAVASVIAAFSTYLAVTRSGAAWTGSGVTMTWLLVANLFLILTLAGLLFDPIRKLIRENRQSGGTARLRLRMIALFALAAMVPTVIVAGFMGALINRGIESWFSDRVYSSVESIAEAARLSLDELTEDVELSTRGMVNDLNAPDTVQGRLEEPGLYIEYLRAQSVYRNLQSVKILRDDGTIAFEVDTEGAPEYVEHSELNWIAARGGTIGMVITPDLVVATLTKLNAYNDLYLYAARQGSENLATQLQLAQEGVTALREAEARKLELRSTLILSYAEAAMIVVLGTAWLGMSAARRIATPIGTLASAARAVRDGDLTVRLERPHVRDEIDELTEAFNQMTMRLGRQTHDLERSREDAETRSEFIEAVLAGVEAGVIRVDAAFNITIANTSAKRLLGMTDAGLEGQSLTEVAPDFVQHVRRALEGGKSVGANLERRNDETTQDLHARIAPEADKGGCVITFHDTTSLAAGHRQAAWRDVARRIAHEIRNPLTPIQLSAERLKRRFAVQITDDRETFDRCTATILRQVSDIGRMVEEFSAFARMPKPTMALFDVSELARTVSFAQKMASPALQVTSSMPDGSIKVMGDERLLGQALTNVVKNACEAVERHISTGVAKSGQVSITVSKQDSTILLRIQDTGVGFPVEERDRLLEPYVTTRESGVGLGLAIVNRIVEDHGGSINLGDNEDAGHGARVDIVLPLPETQPVHGEENASQGVN